VFKLMPDPGVIPTKPPPQFGERIVIEVEGLPPYKDVNRSIRNVRHPLYPAFMRLREEAIKQMDGRAWVEADLSLSLIIFIPGGSLEDTGRSLIDYLGGVMDTLDGSHGPSFTYLPIVMQDDRQITGGRWETREGDRPHYQVKVTFP